MNLMMVVLILVMMHHTRVLTRERERNKTNYILDCDGRLRYSNIVSRTTFLTL
jgi:hypothetical protein